MNARKFYQLDSLTDGKKQIYPIVLLDILFFKNTFFNFEYEVSAFKIIENKKIYFVNINLSNKDFKYICEKFKKYD